MARHLLDKNEQKRISFFLTMMQQANHILFISNKIHTLIFRLMSRLTPDVLKKNK